MIGDFSIIYTRDIPRRSSTQAQIDRIGFLPDKRNWIDRVMTLPSLSLILTGQGVLHYQGNVQVIEAPCAMLHRPRQHYRYGPNTCWDEVFVVFAATWFAFVQKYRLSLSHSPLWPLTAPELTQGLVSQLEYASNSVDMPGVIDVIDQLAGCILQSSLATAGVGVRDPVERCLLEQAAFWRRRPDSQNSIEQIAHDCGLSVAQFRRRWKKSFGSSPHEWLTGLRLQQACEFLSETELSIKVIAERVGYADPRHFAAIFRARRGVNPAKWRQENTKKNSPLFKI